ncbi:STAS/SEC14 domain-containing protein [Sungkyunkwania multivorans]|uniref:STAS/SEC14 domain-containing protein n=1 Tax=Sungkyunkwania multivorans TaxID=1173618 RepID=A0ABW3CVS3_9FLAO
MTKEIGAILKTYHLNVGKLTICDSYMIAEIDEGVTLNMENASELIKAAELHFKNTPFVYITHRKNSYAVDPINYIEVMKLTQLKGIAIVSSKQIDKKNFNVEQRFFGRPMQIFDNLADAINWHKEILKESYG